MTPPTPLFSIQTCQAGISDDEYSVSPSVRGKVRSRTSIVQYPPPSKSLHLPTYQTQQQYASPIHNPRSYLLNRVCFGHIHRLLYRRLEPISPSEPTLAPSRQIPQRADHVLRPCLGNLDRLLYLALHTKPERLIVDRGYPWEPVLCCCYQCNSLSRHSCG